MNVITKHIFSRVWHQHCSIYDNAVACTRLYSSTCTCVRYRPKPNLGNQLMKNSTVSMMNLRYFMSPIRRSLKNTLGVLYKKILSIDQTKEHRAGLAWYKTLDEVNFIDFIVLLEMPDTFQSWVKILQLHVWMMLVRLMQLKEEGSVLRASLIETMWEDVEKRAKMIQPLNKNFKVNMKDFTNDFRMSLFILDDGYLSNDASLAGALWYQVFEKNCDDPKKLESLVSYVRYQLYYMQTLPTYPGDSDKIQGPVWTSFRPHFEKLN